MGAKAPPVPKAQRSRIIRGASSPAERDAEVSRDPSRDQSGMNLKEQGAAGNLRQNMHHQQGR